jgi:hypothetical protein
LKKLAFVDCDIVRERFAGRIRDGIARRSVIGIPGRKYERIGVLAPHSMPNRHKSIIGGRAWRRNRAVRAAQIG